MIKLKVISGTIGVCVMENEQIVDEQVVPVSIQQGQISSRISNLAAFSLILRNASTPRQWWILRSVPDGASGFSCGCAGRCWSRRSLSQ